MLWTFTNQPGLHALVVGVGDYPHLLGGSGSLSGDNSGMGQLSSAPHSAVAIARWLCDEYTKANAGVPLASLELLLSAPTPQTFVPRLPGTAAGLPARATMQAFSTAADGWFKRLDVDPKNRAFFFFAGHGALSGMQQTLFLEDFGSLSNALLHAVDFTKLHVGMDLCAAREQLFLVDACRVGSRLIAGSVGNYGQSVLKTSGMPARKTRAAPVLYSTLQGASAYGRPQQRTLFTEALLEALKGAGADEVGGSWVIRPSALRVSTNWYLNRLARQAKATQSCTMDSVANFDFHELSGDPDVPVVVECAAPIDLQTWSVKATSGTANRELLPPSSSPWELTLSPDKYAFVAVDPGGRASPPRSKLVMPPAAEVDLP